MSRARAVAWSVLILGAPVLGQPVAPSADSPDGDPFVEHAMSDADEHPIDFGVDRGRTLRSPSVEAVFAGELPEGDGPSDVEFTPDGSAFVIAHRESKNLIVWDAATRAFVRAIDVPGAAQAFALTPDGQTAAVALVDVDQVSIIDMPTSSVAATLPVGLNPGVVRVMPAGDLAVVGVTGEAKLAVVDLASRSVVRTIPGVAFSQSFGFAPETGAVTLSYSEFEVLDNDRVLNLDVFGDAAQFVNVRTGVVTNVPIDPDSAGFSVSGDGSTIAIAHWFGARQITVLDAATESITGTIAAPVDLSGEIVLDQTGSRAVVTVSNACRGVNMTTGVFDGATLDTASLYKLIRSPDGQRAIGVGYRGSVIDLATGTLLGNPNQLVSTNLGAVSPVGNRAALVSTTFGEDFVVLDTDATPTAEAFRLTGPDPEADKVRTAAISPDGSVAVGVGIFSDTASIVDTASATLTGLGRAGMRSSTAAITPDNARAVVANLDDNFATIIDLAPVTSTNITISRRASRVLISPDGAYAYLAVVADGDGVWRLNLGTNAVDGAKLLTGNMGSVGYAYSQNSDMKLNADGSVLAVAGSFTDNVTLIDTAAWSVLANVPVGDFPTFLAFSPDGGTLAVTNRNDDTVSLIAVNGAASAVTDTVGVGDTPGYVTASDDGRFFVVNFADATIGVIDAALAMQTATLPVPAGTLTGLHADNAGRRLYACVSDSSTTLGGSVGFSQSDAGELRVYDLDTLALEETLDLGAGPTDMAVSADGDTVALAAIQAGTVLVVRLGECVPDIDGNGVLNLDDIILFADAFVAGEPQADIDGNTVLNLDDIILFADAFVAGCP